MKTLGREQDKVEVLGRLRRLRPQTERRFGRMSAHQMVCHLADALRMGLGQKAVRDASGPPPRRSGGEYGGGRRGGPRRRPRR